MSERLPAGWVWVSVDDLVATRNVLTDGPFGSNLKTEHYQDSGPRVIRLQNIGDGEFLNDEAHISGAHFARLRKHEAVAGDIVVAMLGSNLPRACLVPRSIGLAIVKADCVRLRPDTRLVDRRYAVAGFNSPTVRHQAKALVHGVGRPRLGLKWFRALRFPLAPVLEQARIMDAVDSHLSRLDAAVASLESAQVKLKAYRASVLKAAVEGRLVPTEAELARKEGRSYEAADVLLERILTERRRCWEEAELAKMKAAGKTPKDGRWKANYEEPESLDAIPLPRLPDGWCWVPASAMYWDAGYGTSAKCTEDGNGPAVLRIPNIVEGRVGLDDLKFAADDAALRADDRVRQGDFLFIRTNGSRSLIGRGALVLHETDNPLFFASYLIRLRLLTVDSCDRWFALAWSGPQVREQVLRVAASSAGQHNISLSAASSFAIPLPPAAEQARILEEFERLDSGANVVDRDIATGVGRSDRLRQAVLKWAFQGKLVDQDPSDEPAEVLLARIRAEREAVAPCKSKPTRRRKLRVAS